VTACLLGGCVCAPSFSAFSFRSSGSSSRSEPSAPDASATAAEAVGDPEASAELETVADAAAAGEGAGIAATERPVIVVLKKREIPPAGPLGPIALELGVGAGTETLFRDCTNPDGGSAGVTVGVGWRRPRGPAVLLRGGATAAYLAEAHEDPSQARTQLWGGVGLRAGGRHEIAYGLTSFLSRSRYYRDAPVEYSTGSMDAPNFVEAWGGGLSFEIYSRAAGTAVSFAARAYADSQGLFGGLTLGVAWLR
jgi:hypothetical protein